MTAVNDDQPLSRTKKKQQAHQIAELAGQLCELSDNRFGRIELPAEIVAEAQTVRQTGGRGSHKRQLKYLAGLLREDPDAVESLRLQLEGMDQVDRSDKKQFHSLEHMRDRLCDPQQFDQAFSELQDQAPHLDIKTIRRLAQSVHQHGDKRAYREIFKRLRDEGVKD
ncbi:MAG: ribosome biogenesis factor YjgA [Pelovirga sp.]